MNIDAITEEQAQKYYERVYSALVSTNPLGGVERREYVRRIKREHPEIVAAVQDTIFCEINDY